MDFKSLNEICMMPEAVAFDRMDRSDLIMMKLVCSVLLAFSLISSCFGETIYEAPFSIEAVITETLEPVVKGSTVTISTSSFRVTNKELIQECVSRGLIQSSPGWSIVVYYDAEVDSSTEVALRLRHRDGTVADLSPVLSVSGAGATNVARMTFSKNSVSGTFSLRRHFQITANYQGYTGVCTGAVQYSGRFTGPPDKVCQIVSPFTAKVDGTVDGLDSALIAATIKVGPFSRK